MKRTELRRKSWMKRGTKKLRGRAPQKMRLTRNSSRKKAWRRKPSDFARIYGSKARVEWVKQQPCVVCVGLHLIFSFVTGRSHNAHTANGGRGRKGDYTTIVPLCYSHHRCYDEHRYPCDQPEIRQAIKDAASEVERRWQERLHASERSERVPKEGT